MKKLALSTALAAMAILPAAQASASGDDGARVVSVTTADLDLSLARDRAKLEQRVDAAAREACGFERNTRDIRRAAIRDCYKNAKAKAEQRIAAIAQAQARGG